MRKKEVKCEKVVVIKKSQLQQIVQKCLCGYQKSISISTNLELDTEFKFSYPTKILLTIIIIISSIFCCLFCFNSFCEQILLIIFVDDLFAFIFKSRVSFFWCHGAISDLSINFFKGRVHFGKADRWDR